MTTNQLQTDELCHNYVTHIVDGLDIQSMELLCYELLMDSYHKCTWDELTEEIKDLYDEETLTDLIPDTK